MFNVDGVYEACLFVFLTGCATFGLLGLGLGYIIWG